MRTNTSSENTPTLPLEAQKEILDKLFAEKHITSDDIVKILKKYEVNGDVEALQDGYRRRVGQRLMASIRDGDGKREVLSGKGRDYIIVECCNNTDQLIAVRHRIESQIEGLTESVGKVRGRIGLIIRLDRLFRRTV